MASLRRICRRGGASTAVAAAAEAARRGCLGAGPLLPLSLRAAASGRPVPRANEPDGGHTAFSWLTAGLTVTASPRGRLLQGLHALDVHNDWILFNERTAQEMLTKTLDAYASSETADLYLRQMEGTQDAQKEVLDMLLDFLPQRYPSNFSVAGRAADGAFPPDAVVCVRIGDSRMEFRIGDYSDFPLKLASLLVQEDLVIMQNGRLVAGSVLCSFSRFGESRFGQDLKELHAKVAQFQNDLERPVLRIFETLKFENPLWRTNWNISWSDEIMVNPRRYPMKKGQMGADEQNAIMRELRQRIQEVGIANATFMKTEYQTCRRLRRNDDCVLFTIRTLIDPMTMLADLPRAARQLAMNVRILEPVEFCHYIGLSDDYIRHSLLEHADGIAVHAK